MDSWEQICDYSGEKRGLKEHIYRCGDLSKFFKSVTILEDDLYVSPFFMITLNKL